MTTQAYQRFKALMGTSAKLTLAEYLRERERKMTEQLVNCTEATFKQQQGRVLEIRDLLREIGE